MALEYGDTVPGCGYPVCGGAENSELQVPTRDSLGAYEDSSGLAAEGCPVEDIQTSLDPNPKLA